MMFSRPRFLSWLSTMCHGAHPELVSTSIVLPSRREVRHVALDVHLRLTRASGAGRAICLNTRGLVRSVIRRIVPLPALSTPSNTMQTLAPSGAADRSGAAAA